MSCPRYGEAYTSWQANPFNWRQPAQGLHCLGIISLVFGLVLALRGFSPLVNEDTMAGVGIWAGVCSSVFLFPKRFSSGKSLGGMKADLEEKVVDK